MAKKKSKKSNSNLGLIVVLAAVILGLAATCMIFLTAFNGVAAFDLSIVQGENTTAFTGVQASFGYSKVTEAWGSTISTEVLTSNFTSLMAYLLPAIAAIVLVLFKDLKVINYACAGAFLASAVFAFISATTFLNCIVLEFYTAYDYTLGVGSILCGCFSAISGLLVLYKLVVLDK